MMKHSKTIEQKTTMLLLIAISSVGAISMANNAYAAVPTTTLFEANDPDDGDNIFSAGDTILIRFSEATNATNGGTMTPTEFNANFTIAGGITSFDGTFTGTWQTGSTELVITWTTIGSNVPVVGSTTIEEKATTTIFDAVGAFKYADTPDTLTGDFGLAVGSTIVLYEANDPNDGDNIFSADDTILIRFSEGINATNGGTLTPTEFNANFTIGGTAAFDGTFTGTWQTPDANGPTELLITWTIIGVNTPIVGTTTIDDNAATTNLFDAVTTSIIFTENGLDTLSGDFGIPAGGGEVPKGGHPPPTLGVTKRGQQLVDNGFSYNGNPVDVEYYYTPYPLITVNVGEENVVKLKIYSKRGIEQIRHVALAFGLAHGQIFGESKAVIEWDKLWNGIETLNVIDSQNSLENVRVVTSKGQCKADSDREDCLIVKIYHTFRQSLDFNVVGTYVWDDIRAGWNNYYNDGVEIQGESLNPPAKHQVNHKAELIQITETGKNTAVDQNGNKWFFNKSWKMDYIPTGKIDEGITSHGFDRNHVKFSTYQQGQELIAKNILSAVLGGKEIQNDSLVDPLFHESKNLKRSEDIELQNLIADEKHRANSWYSDHFVVTTEDEYNRYLNIYKKFYEQNH